MSEDNAYKVAYEREKKARMLAEKLLNDKTRELYENVLNLQTTVAELNDTQAQLVQAEKMASLGQLSAGMAHEINNPIGFSYSNLSCLQEYLSDFFQLDNLITKPEEPNNDAEVLLKSYLQLHQKINANYIKEDIPILLSDTLEGLNRVKKIVANLKKISYKGDNEFICCDINECINDCLKVAKSELKYSMEIELILNDCPEIYGQPSDLNQVFINLFINASHACKENGKLTIKSFHDENNVIVSIKDNGAGIAPENLQKIFDPFYTSKAVGEGTGLGLSISHGIIEKHGGSIQVESVENQGTCFTISLPIEQEF